MANAPRGRRLDEFVELAVRAFSGEPRQRGSSDDEWPYEVLVLDTETTTDAAQALLFGCYRYLRGNNCLEEGFFYDPALSPGEVSLIEDFGRRHEADVLPGVERKLKVYALPEFLDRVLHRVAVGVRGGVAGFNVPFDLSRLAFEAAEGRRTFAGGFSFALFGYRDEAGVLHPTQYRPRLGVKSIDGRRALIRWIAAAKAEPSSDLGESESVTSAERFGPILDLGTLAFALTDESHSLESACKAFGVPYRKRQVTHGTVHWENLVYCREDVAATAALYGRLLAEHRRHPIKLSPAHAYSPASIGKAYLRAMNVSPPLALQPDFERERLGQAMVAYYGGRAECHVRKTVVPVVYLDFLAMYPSVCALTHLWALLTAERIETVDITAEVEAMLTSLSLEDCFEQDWWERLVCLVKVEPRGEVFPVRAKYADGASWQIGVNAVSSCEPLWYTLADVVASTLLTGRAPRVLEAVRFVGAGEHQTWLGATTLRGAVPVDASDREADFFRSVIEERRRITSDRGITREERERLDAFLKVLANATSYGIFVELNRRERSGKRKTKVRVYGLDGEFECGVASPEAPGEFVFPPIGAVIAGGARLMLALLERLVTDTGGTFAFCDTDSMAIVASEAGGVVLCEGGTVTTPEGFEAVRVLSCAEVEGIRDRFSALNPYDRTLVTDSLLELEAENFKPRSSEALQLYCYAISAKRYALFNLVEGFPVIRRYSEHGLGHLLNPIGPEGDRRWIRRLWRQLVRETLGRGGRTPSWHDRLAIGQITVSSPTLLEPFAALNEGKPYREQVKPFNFLLTAFVAPFGHPQGVDPARFHLVAPWERDPERWLDLDWIDRYSGEHFRVRTERRFRDFEGVAEVKTIAQVIGAYSAHAEVKSLGPDGAVCGRRTRGVLSRREHTVCAIRHIGKETNLLDEVLAGIRHDPEEVLSEYADPRRDPWSSLVLPILGEMTPSEIVASTGLDRSTVKRMRSGATVPHRRNRKILTAVAAELARGRLRGMGHIPPRGDLPALCAYRSLVAEQSW